MIEILHTVFIGLLYLLGILSISLFVFMLFCVLKGAIQKAAEELKQDRKEQQ